MNEEELKADAAAFFEAHKERWQAHPEWTAEKVARDAAGDWLAVTADRLAALIADAEETLLAEDHFHASGDPDQDYETYSKNLAAHVPTDPDPDPALTVQATRSRLRSIEADVRKIADWLKT